jgi:hypothetical protein
MVQIHPSLLNCSFVVSLAKPGYFLKPDTIAAPMIPATVIAEREDFGVFCGVAAFAQVMFRPAGSPLALSKPGQCPRRKT